jgi:uncharacterized protein YdhG (YjbR/CyaY superfamily)
MKSGNRRSSSKARGAPKTVEAYLESIPEPARSTLNKIRASIRSVAPAESIEVISYGMPAFKYKGILVWYAAFSNHCSLFPTASTIQEFKDELRDYTTSKGTIQFPPDKPLPAALVKKLVKARIAQNENRKRR